MGEGGLRDGGFRVPNPLEMVRQVLQRGVDLLRGTSTCRPVN